MRGNAMKKFLIPILILPLIFLTGCSEEDDAGTGSGESYTVDDLDGTWNTTYGLMDMDMSMDFSSIFGELDEESCVELGGTYSNSSCDIPDFIIAIAADEGCSEMGGTLSGTTCTMSIEEQICCEEGQSQTITIESHGDHGDITIVSTNADGSLSESGEIVVDGTDITMSMVDLDSGDLDVMHGTLDIDGDTATIIFDMNMDDMMVDDSTGGMEISASMILIMEKN